MAGHHAVAKSHHSLILAVQSLWAFCYKTMRNPAALMIQCMYVLYEK